MGLRARILRVTTETGPRSMNVLRGLVRTPVQAAQFDKIIKAMRAAGELKKYGKRKDAKWGAPGWKRPPRRRFE